MPRVAVAYLAIAFAAGILAAEYAPLWLSAVVSGIVILAAAGPMRPLGRDLKSRPSGESRSNPRGPPAREPGS